MAKTTTLREAFEAVHRSPRVKPAVFMFYGTTPRVTAWLHRGLSETRCNVLAGRSVLDRTSLFRNLIEMREVFAVDVSGMAYRDISEVHRALERADYVPTIYLREDSRPLMTESWLRIQSTVGCMKRGLARDIVTVSETKNMLAHMKTLLEADLEKPKQPSEVDRLKLQQKQEVILQKKRQAQELLNAQQRELQKKSREDMNKISNGTKKSFTR